MCIRDRAVDAQGYLREVRGEKVYPIDWTDKVEALKYIDILKVNDCLLYTSTHILIFIIKTGNKRYSTIKYLRYPLL